jgi:uncharacterized membrane protein YidH (DUF202 family)
MQIAMFAGRFLAICDGDHDQTRLQQAWIAGDTIGTPTALAMNNMKQIIGIAILAVGIVLLCMAYDSYHSAASGVSRVVTGTSTDKTMWLLIGGVLGTLAGIGGLITGSRKA